MIIVHWVEQTLAFYVFLLRTLRGRLNLKRSRLITSANHWFITNHLNIMYFTWKKIIAISVRNNILHMRKESLKNSDLYSIIKSTTGKNCSVALIWMVTLQDFMHIPKNSNPWPLRYCGAAYPVRAFFFWFSFLNCRSCLYNSSMFFHYSSPCRSYIWFPYIHFFIIGQLHDDDIWLQLPEFISVLLCYWNLSIPLRIKE